MPWTNYHSHTNFSDGSDLALNYIEEAIRQGMLIYGFSCHAPVPFETKWSMKSENLELYFDEIEKLKKVNASSITILASLELDYIPGKVSPADAYLEKFPLDYRIGSIHFVDCLPDGYPWGIDGPAVLFAEGLAKIWRGDIRKAVQRYFHLLREMIYKARPDIIGHFDKIRMHNEGNRYFSEDENWYKNEVFQSLELLREFNCLLEVNTRGMYRGLKKEPYPSLWVLREARRMGIPVVMNSDAHKPNEISACFAEASVMLKECGYMKLHNFIEGTWRELSYDKNGVHF